MVDRRTGDDKSQSMTLFNTSALRALALRGRLRRAVREQVLSVWCC